MTRGCGGCAALIRPTTASDAISPTKPTTAVRVGQISEAHLPALRRLSEAWVAAGIATVVREARLNRTFEPPPASPRSSIATPVRDARLRRMRCAYPPYAHNGDGLRWRDRVACGRRVDKRSASAGSFADSPTPQCCARCPHRPNADRATRARSTATRCVAGAYCALPVPAASASAWRPASSEASRVALKALLAYQFGQTSLVTMRSPTW